MSQTSKARVQALLPHLEAVFTHAHPADVAEIVDEIRGHLTRLKSAANQAAYGKHANRATGAS